jgi:predicted helicase
MMQKVDGRYWEQWAKSVAEIVERQIERIGKIVETGEFKSAFDEFMNGLQNNINPSITPQEAIEMLSQHTITKPVFEALFDGYSFVKNNPISISMQRMLDLLEARSLADDVEMLEKFYESVRKRASNIDNAEGKQRIIVELYDKFFKTAFPKMVELLGIVYTPVEIVDFIICSVDDVLRKEFGRGLTDKDVNILDPFTGTGTFITRLIQSGLIQKKDLPRKYESEIFANEIVLLACYIAAVNIENAYHDAMNLDAYKSFAGICLTDTFQLGETDDVKNLFSEILPKNSKRIQHQKKSAITVIIGNPPYSIGQKSANDNAQNQSYPTLEKRIAETYVQLGNATLVKSLYDAYIKAFRWASDRLDKTRGGVIAFITNNGWIEKGGNEGFRKCLEKDFSSIYVFNLRGSIRGRSGEAARKEGQNVFDIMTGVAITILIKNPATKNDKATIHYYDVGDYLNRKEKLKILSATKSILNPSLNTQLLSPNKHGDWISKRNDAFSNFIPLEPEKKFDTKTQSFFVMHSLGITTNKDAWLYNFSNKTLTSNLTTMVKYYNEQRALYHTKTDKKHAKNTVQYDTTKISWTDMFLKDLENNIAYTVDKQKICHALYRPFTRQQFCYEKQFLQRTYQQTKIFPTPNSKNLVICLSCTGSNRELSVLVTNIIPDLHAVGDTQCFPLYYYEQNQRQKKTIFDTEADYIRRDGLSDFILDRARKQYGKNVTKEDIFYYVYGFLHSPKYREMFVADLKKMLPRLPLVDEPKMFWQFSKSGRELAELHLNYEQVKPHPSVIVEYNPLTTSDFTKQVNKAELEYLNYRVEKMYFAKNPKKNQKDSIIYNNQITIKNIPKEARQYIINGKSAIEWIMNRYTITTHKNSNIKNNPNNWAKENNDPKYILNLLMSVINVSVRTIEIVKTLPELVF